MSLERLKRIVSEGRNMVFLGGAGISTESGIPDFRSETGLYRAFDGNSYPPETILSHSFFMAHTEEFYRFYRAKMIYSDALPNPAHLALAELERRGGLKAVITQNIDSLHQAAGSRNVIELHGSVYRNYCMECGRKYDLEYIINSQSVIPRCEDCGCIVKPDVVLYEEILDKKLLKKAVEYISRADVLIIGGTSLKVYPAAGLIDYFRGENLVLINKSATPYDKAAGIVIHDSAAIVLVNIL